MSKVTVAETAGFCYGVNRAVLLVDRLLREGKKVATFGPIIHNPQVVHDFAERGVTICRDPDTVPPDATLVIRSHGVPKKVYEQLEARGISFVDATCPYVEKIHQVAENAVQKGHTVFVGGDPNHPEVEGICGFCNQNYQVFKNSDELQQKLNNGIYGNKLPITVVFQTTFDVQEQKKCEEIIKKLCTNAFFFDTICGATFKRQAEAERLAKQSDLMVVIGGRQSSNTQKLYKICSAYCLTRHIESADELDRHEVAAAKNIGVTAGASTPSGIIKEVQSIMSEIKEAMDEAQVPAAESEKSEAVAAVEEAVNQEPVAAEPPAQETAPAQKSFEEMTYEEALEQSLSAMNTDQRVKGVVLRITPTEIQVDVGRKQAGYVPVDEYSNDPTVNLQDEVKVGDTLDLIVMRTNDQEGTVMLSKRRFDAINSWEEICQAAGNDTTFEGTVVEIIKGGVLVMYKGIRVFVPASQATASRNDPLDDLLHKKVNFRILEVNRSRRRAVGSIRATLRDQRREQEEAFWSTVEEGKVYTGKVKSMTTYGAFVDLGGVDGMVHISELSWKRIKHPREVVSVGDVIEVYVKSFDKENHKVSLGYKKAEDNPWNIFLRDYHVDDVIKVTIVSMTTYGAFANIIDGVDGLIHISQISDTRIDKPQDVLKIGQEVEVKITAIDTERKRISLSMRALLEGAEEAKPEAAPEAAETSEAPAAPEAPEAPEAQE